MTSASSAIDVNNLRGGPVANFSIQRTLNIGDLACPPGLYFPELRAALRDIRDPAEGHHVFGIFGGGALGQWINRRLHERLAAQFNIAWGVGTSIHRQKDVPAAPQGFVLYGSRDFGQERAIWVPCASCMSPLFDRDYIVRHDTVIYHNHDAKFPRPDISGHPVQNNYIPFEQAIEFLGSGAKVVTNSYHGAYWAMLLGRKVVLAAPYSSKFYHYRHPPEISEDKSWIPALSCHGQNDRGALEECRDANREFLKLALDRML